MRVRLVATGEVVAEALAPRDDTAQPVTRNFGARDNKPAVIELVDGLPRSAYAWIAVAQIEPPVVACPPDEPEVVARGRTPPRSWPTLGLRDLEAPEGAAPRAHADRAPPGLRGDRSVPS